MRAPLTTRLRAAYDKHVGPAERPPLVAWLGFGVTFGITRAVTTWLHDGHGPAAGGMVVGGRHLHHYNIGILLTDHQFRETLEVTDRCYVIREGRVFAYGNREEILNNPEVRRHYIGERFDGGHLLEAQRPNAPVPKPPALPSAPPPPPIVSISYPPAADEFENDPDDPESIQRRIVDEARGYVQGGSHSIQVNQIPPDFNIDDLYRKD